MRRPPPPHPRGEPRTAGSGRKKGTPNRKTLELRQLMGALAGDVDYQERFSSAFSPAPPAPQHRDEGVGLRRRHARRAGPGLRRRHDEPEAGSGTRTVPPAPIEQLEILAAESHAANARPKTQGRVALKLTY